MYCSSILIVLYRILNRSYLWCFSCGEFMAFVTRVRIVHLRDLFELCLSLLSWRHTHLREINKYKYKLFTITYAMFCYIFLPAKRVYFATCKLLENTRLPSNLRPTTHECVHLITRGNFRSRDKDGCHAIRPVIAENPIQHVNLMASCFIERSCSRSKYYIVRIGIFDLFGFWDLDDLHIWTWSVFLESADIPDVQI